MVHDHLTRPGGGDPGAGLREPVELAPPAAAVIDGYLDQLAARLPGYAPIDAKVAAELRDDLLDATLAWLSRSPDQVAAARAAVAEFGDPTTVAESLRPELASRVVRRLGLTLLVTGPLVGSCWVLALVLGDAAPPWHLLPVLAAPLLLIGAPAVVLTVVSTGRLARWISPSAAAASGTVATVTAAAGDAVLLGGSALLLLAPVGPPSSLLAVAVAASLGRLAFIGLAAGRLLGAQRGLATLTAAR